MEKPIPAFYCCYLLRSTVRHASLYIGSTPNPVRRLKQHNSVAKGGAQRTSRNNLRPWEMVCIVSGLPSKIAALQFEWAWQNTYITRHIREQSAPGGQPTSRSPKIRREQVASGRSLKDRLLNLRLLLQVKSFQRWPLEVRFFAKDVFKAWSKVGETTGLGVVREGIQVIADTASGDLREEGEGVQRGFAVPKNLRAIDIAYEGDKQHLEKSLGVLKASGLGNCSVCLQKLCPDSDLLVVCPQDGCRMISHLTCLGQRFLAGKEDQGFVLPMDGNCPICKGRLRWITLVRDLSLRVRAPTIVDSLFKKPRRRRGAEPDVPPMAKSATDMCDEDDDDSDMEATISRVAVSQRAVPSYIAAAGGNAKLRHCEKAWSVIEDDSFESLSDLSDEPEVDSYRFDAPPTKNGLGGTRRRISTMDSSDWDDAEILT